MAISQIWAPWRMEYILGQKHGGCVFCDMAKAPPGEFRERLVLIAQPHAYVCLNRYPFAASHLLVIPRRHVADIASLTDDELSEVAHLVRDSSARLRQAISAEGFNIGFNIGAAAGAGIAEHLHSHIVPRWVGDTNFMPTLADTRVMPEYLDDSWKRLYPYFSDLPGEQGPQP